jgi:UDP-glucose 4-epimerase
MKVGVTGGMGFIGSYVIDVLIERGHEPFIMDRTVRANNQYPEDIEVFHGDVTDEASMREFAAHTEAMIHLAAVLGTQETIAYPIPAAKTNLQGGLTFLEAAAQYRLPAVYIAVGNWWMNNPYSITKNMIERFCHMYNADRSARVNIVRAVNAYGPRQSIAAPFGPSKVRKITPAFICRALSNMPIEVYGDGSQISDMVYVGDVARALVKALETAADGVVFDHAIEIGPIEHQTVRETASKVIDAATELGCDPVTINELPMRPGEELGATVTAKTETITQIGMNPDDLVPFDLGIRETVRWFRSVKGTLWQPPMR